MEGQLYNAFLYNELEHLFWNPSPAPLVDTKRWVYIILGTAERTCAHIFTIISPFPCFLFLLYPVKVSVPIQCLFYVWAKQSDACWGLGGGWRVLLQSLHLAVWVIEGLLHHVEGILRKGNLSDPLWGLIFPSYYRSIWLLKKKKLKLLSHVQLFVTLWTVAHQATLSIGILQARILERVAISFSRGFSRSKDQTQVSHTAGRLFIFWATREPWLLIDTCNCCVQSLSRVQLFVTPWTVACQAPLSMGFSRQQFWSRRPFSPVGDLPDPGIEPTSPALQADSLPAELFGKPNAIARYC